MSQAGQNPVQRLLLSFAHPDDESFGIGGTIAHYTAMGVDVSLICATNGDVGTADEAHLEQYASMTELRLAEMRCAAETLGFSDVYLFGYRDSGMAGSPDNDHPDCLWAQDTHEVARRITEIIRKERPHVVVTFDPFGGYGHPDHIKMHEATTEAFHAAGDADAFPEQIAAGLEPYQPQKLYYSTFDRRFAKALVAVMPLLGHDPERMGRNQDINFREIASHAYPIHARIDTRAVEAQAEAARQCHSSQLGGFARSGLLDRLWGLFRASGVDTFMRAYPPVNGSRVRETDLFEGVVVR